MKVDIEASLAAVDMKKIEEHLKTIQPQIEKGRTLEKHPNLFADLFFLLHGHFGEVLPAI